ncbi:MAG: glycosyltransferase family 4 protein [Phycisphaerae bacterium]|nr:glycosyltransferase family 4 protein [Phycisphaerae bacterium]
MMRIIQLTPGSGDFYCENCLRDNVLIKSLRAAGHDAVMVPMYLPVRSDEPGAEKQEPVFFGGINVYLQQKSALFRKAPAWVDCLFNMRWLLKWVSSKAGMTRAGGLGEMTVSMLRGIEGRQAKELGKLVDWLAADGAADVVCLSNGLLAGVAPAIRERLGCPVVCLLQDEDGWLDVLPEPFRGQAWRALSHRGGAIDAFVAVSDYYKELMQGRLGLADERISVVHPGIELAGYGPAEGSPEVPTVGYLSPMCEPKGLGLLVDAFVRLKGFAGCEKARLRVAGGHAAGDKAFIRQMQERLSRAGFGKDVEFLGNLDRRGKQEFLKTLSVLSVPTTRGEAFGLFVLESLAAGVPVVQPRHGAFVELLDATGGGLLCEPNDAESLAHQLATLLADPARARELGMRGRRAVTDKFSAERMARNMMQVFEAVVDSPSRRPMTEQKNV